MTKACLFTNLITKLNPLPQTFQARKQMSKFTCLLKIPFSLLLSFIRTPNMIYKIIIIFCDQIGEQGKGEQEIYKVFYFS